MAKTSIQEAAMDYMSSHERNFYAEGNNVTLYIGPTAVDVETIWYSDKEDKIYLHCGCKEFEGDIDIDSLSDDNQRRMMEAFGIDTKRKKRERLTKETIVLLAADIYQTIYDRDECDGWGDACDDIIRYAEQFEKELDWQEDDERDYIVELEKFEKKVLDELNK